MRLHRKIESKHHTIDTQVALPSTMETTTVSPPPTGATNNSNNKIKDDDDPLETAKWTRYLPEAFGIQEAVRQSSYRWCVREGGMWGIATGTAMSL